MRLEVGGPGTRSLQGLLVCHVLLNPVSRASIGDRRGVRDGRANTIGGGLQRLLRAW
jgi:hypothetical protein